MLYLHVHVAVLSHVHCSELIANIIIMDITVVLELFADDIFKVQAKKLIE